jgi:hypothetical protein
MEALLNNVTVPAWAAAIGAIAVVLVVISLFRSGSHESHGSLSVLTQLALVVVIGGAAYLGLRHLEDSAKRSERHALEDRAAALLARASQPGSVLACLDSPAEPALAEACERTLFAEPQRVAAAIAHVRERLLFVADAVHYAEAKDPGYLERIRELRQDLESDAYGFVAHVLATEDKCTASSCARFRILRELDKVKENIAGKKLESLVTKHASAWREPERQAGEKSEVVVPSVVAPPPPAPETPPAPPAAAAPPPASAPPTAPRPGTAKQKEKDKDKGGPRAAVGRRIPEPVAGLPRVVPRRYLEPEEEEEAPPPRARPGAAPAATPPAASTLPPPTSISPPRQN